MFAKIKTFLNEHQNIFQLIKYALFSLIATVVEYGSFAILSLSLKGTNQMFSWWIFEYNTLAGGLGAFIAFLISNILAQITSFIVNRKNTFNANNNLAFSAIAYAIMVLAIIVLNTWMGSILTNALNKVVKNIIISQYIGKIIGSFSAFLITFFMNKFVIMRRTEPKKEEEKVVTEAVAEGVAASIDNEEK